MTYPYKLRVLHPLVALPPLVLPPMALPPPEVFDAFSNLRLDNCDRLTLSVVGGRWTGGTVNCVMRQFRSTEDATFSTVAVEETVGALLAGVSEAPELELDEDKVCAFRAAILKLYKKARE